MSDTLISLREAVARIDLSSADGRAGLGGLLRELEHRAPDALVQAAARVQLRAVACARVAPDEVTRR
ncbi:hypothetical protein [Brevundimonas lutea]|uniref:hypothetical protein n=1 Tax=Brevundimonas lutea TaxID=2293980 RepID=UPI000F0154D4|nr:hypothetical protein [Brevundimonas lutea]